MQLGPNTPASDLSEQAPHGDPGAVNAPATTRTPGSSSWIQQLRQQNPLLPDILLVGGVVLLVLVMFRVLRKNTRASRRRDNAMGSPADRIAEIHERAESSMEPARKLMVDAENIARRVGATLDNKAARLELLIEEADAKLEQLNRALARNAGATPQAAPPSQTDPAATPSEPAHQPAAPRTLDPTLLDRARVEQDLEDRQSRVAGRINPGPPAHPHPTQPVSVAEQVQQLASEGMSSHEIAQQLRQPIGQVELILNLRRRAEHP